MIFIYNHWRRSWDSFSAEKPRRLRRATGTPPRAAFRIPLYKYPCRKRNAPTRVHFFLAERVGFEPTDTRISPVFKTGAFNHSTISPYCPCHREGRKACGDPYPRRKSGFPCRCAPRNDKDFGGVYCNTNPAGGQSVFNREFCRKVRSRRYAIRSPGDTGRCRRQRRYFRGRIFCRWPADPAPFPPAG